MADQTEQAPKQRGIKREDPPPRPVEQTANRGFLDGRDPGKHYVWVSEVNDPTINVGAYKSLGYKVAQYDPDEARPTLGYQEFKQGDPIKSFGCVLMECPIEHKAAIDKVGWDNADRIQETIRKRDVDPMTPAEQAQYRGIKSVRTETDDRAKWQF